MKRAYIKDDFRDFLEYRHWLNRMFSKLSPRNRQYLGRFTKEFIGSRILSDPSWYGPGATFEHLESGITSYMDPVLLERLLRRMQDRIIATGLSDRIKKQKMDYNALGLGVFSFDRAAMGMYRMKEFFSPSLGRKVESHEVESKDSRQLLSLDGSTVVERWEQRKDGKPKIRTSTKKVYAWFPRQHRDSEAVDIFVLCGGHSMLTAEMILYSGIGAVVTAELLEKAGIRTRISFVNGTHFDTLGTFIGCVVPVKHYDDKLDPNLLAVVTSDPRFYRHEGFKGLICVYDHFGQTIPKGYGKTVKVGELKEAIEESNYAKTANLAPNRFYFGGTYTEEATMAQIEGTLNEIESRHNRNKSQ